MKVLAPGRVAGVALQPSPKVLGVHHADGNGIQLALAGPAHPEK
jgi:hypothetical protein